MPAFPAPGRRSTFQTPTMVGRFSPPLCLLQWPASCFWEVPSRQGVVEVSWPLCMEQGREVAWSTRHSATTSWLSPPEVGWGTCALPPWPLTARFALDAVAPWSPQETPSPPPPSHGCTQVWLIRRYFRNETFLQLRGLLFLCLVVHSDAKGEVGVSLCPLPASQSASLLPVLPGILRSRSTFPQVGCFQWLQDLRPGCQALGSTPFAVSQAAVKPEP